MALELGLGALGALDAHAHSELAWAATAAALAALTAALLYSSSAGIQASLALLAAAFMLRDHDRLLLAPLYGACLLLVGEFSQLSFELRNRPRLAEGVVTSWLAAVVLLAALGGAVAAVAALAVTIAPSRTVVFTAVGSAAAIAVFAAIAALARRTVRAPGEPLPTTDAGREGSSRHRV